jgi:DNA ligase-1
MKFKDFSYELSRLERISSRLAKTEVISEIFKKSEPSEIDKVCYLLLGGLAAPYESIVFNIAERHVLSIISRAYRVDYEEVEKLYKEKGDLGDVAADLAETRNPSHEIQNLSVTKVYEELVRIAKDSGEGSQERKIFEAANLLCKLDPGSVRYVVRILLGKLRLGFSDLTMIDAISWMIKGNKSEKLRLQKFFEVMPDIGVLAAKVKKEGLIAATRDIKPVVGIPVAPMLAQRLKSPVEMIEKMGEVSVEPKFDGVRVLIHFKRGQPGGRQGFIKAFTRNLKNISYMFPELDEIGKYLKADEVILDSEAVGMDEERKVLVDFQTTMQRRRKHNIENLISKVPLSFQVFDILSKDGENLMNKPYIERRKILSDTLVSSSLFKIDGNVITRDAKVISREYLKKIKQGLEGIIVKKTDSEYVPGRTAFRWVKMKQIGVAGKLSDTVDCIVMGYTAGKGKRASFGVGQFLVGIRDGERIRTITKVGTGLSDDLFRELSKRLSRLIVKEKPKEYEVHKDLEPDFWVVPKQVVEIAADDITNSPKHTAGYALRFPRLVKFRDDKSVNEATTLKEVKNLFELQKRN